MIGNANHVTTDLGDAGVEAWGVDRPTCEVARTIGKPLTVEKAKKVMSHRRVLQTINIVSVVLVPSRNKMFLSCGRLRAAEGEFTEYEIFPAEPPK